MISRNMRLTVLAIGVGIALGLASSGLAASEIILHEAIDDYAAGNHSPPAESHNYPAGSGYNRVIILDQTQLGGTGPDASEMGGSEIAAFEFGASPETQPDVDWELIPLD